MLSFVKKKGISDQKVIRGKNIILSRFWRSVCYFSIRIFLDSSSGKHGFHFPIIAVVWLLSQVRLFATPRTVARQASLSFTSTLSLLRLTSIGLMMPSNHLILCHPLLLLPSVFSSISRFQSFTHECIQILFLPVISFYFFMLVFLIPSLCTTESYQKLNFWVKILYFENLLTLKLIPNYLQWNIGEICIHNSNQWIILKFYLWFWMQVIFCLLKIYHPSSVVWHSTVL